VFKGDRNFTVGLFVSIAIAAFVLFVIWLTGRTGADAMTRYTLLFDRDVSGLAIGGPVKFMGMNIGSVIDMDLDTSQGVRVQVDIEILESTPVDTGTYASLALQGITGVAVVNLASVPGTHAPLPEPPRGEYPRIPVREVGFAALLSSAPEIMNKLDIVLTRAGAILNDDHRDSLGKALDNVEALTATLAGSGDELAALPGEVSATLADIRATIGDLRTMFEGMRPDLDQAVANVSRSSENLNRLTARLDELLQQHTDDVDHFLEAGLGEVPALLGETRQALRDLERLLAELQDDPSRLIHRPQNDALEIDP
jgi:phospholipid/cholesterol/gamma-HCH transport system substrate-binding protein